MRLSPTDTFILHFFVNFGGRMKPTKTSTKKIDFLFRFTFSVSAWVFKEWPRMAYTRTCMAYTRKRRRTSSSWRVPNLSKLQPISTFFGKPPFPSSASFTCCHTHEFHLLPQRHQFLLLQHTNTHEFHLLPQHHNCACQCLTRNPKP